MHEVSLCESILKIIERQTQKEKFERVVAVRVQIGKESCVSEEALSFSFPHICKGTIADGAKLEFTLSEGTEMRVVEIEVM